MNYEEKYKEALERARGLYDFYKDNPAQAQKFIDIFHELAESEDEKIRKELIKYFNQFENGELRGVDITPWIAWLEKQGEQKPAEWSEEDENCLYMAIECAKTCGYPNVANWLKSLRPQPKQYHPEWVEKMKACRGKGVEEGHMYGDHVLCDLLTKLGYGDVVDEFEKLDKWYA